MNGKNSNTGKKKLPAVKKTAAKRADIPVIERIAANPVVVLLKNNAWCIAAGLLTLILLLIALSLSSVKFGFGGENSFLYSDLFGEIVPMLTELRGRILTGDGSQWSWAMGLGGDYTGTAYYYLISPMNLFALLTDNAESAAIAIVFSKLVLSAFTASYFFRKAYSGNGIIQTVFGVSYALCGWAAAYYFLTMWLDALYVLPLLLLGCHRIIEYRKPALLYFSAAYILITNFYMAYMVIFFTVMYWAAYYFSRYSIKAEIGEESSYKGKLRNSRLFVSFAMSAGAGVGAVLTAAAVILPTLINITKSGAGNVEAQTVEPDFFKRLTDTLGALMPQSDSIRLLTDAEYPNIYSGVLAVALVPLYFLNKKINRRSKLFFGILTGVLLVSFFSGILTYVWHGFAEVNDFPFRYSFVFTFLVLCLACSALDKTEGLTFPRVLISASFGIAAEVFLLIYSLNGEKTVISTAGIIIALGLTVIYTVLAASTTSRKADRRAVLAVILVFVAVESCAGFTHNIASAVEEEIVREEQEHVVPLLDNISGDGFVGRTELSLPVSPDMGAWYGYNGISVSSSFVKENTLKFMNRLGIETNMRDGAFYYVGDPLSSSILSLDYILDNALDEYKFDDTQLFSAVTRNEDYTLLHNNYALPGVYAVNGDMREWGEELSDTAVYKNMNSFATTAAGVDGVLFPVDISPKSAMPNLRLNPNPDGSCSFENYSLGTGTIDLSFSAPQTSSYYYYLKMDFQNEYSGANMYSGSFPAEANPSYSMPFSRYIGFYKAGDTVNVSIDIRSLSKGTFSAYIAGVDYRKLGEYYDNVNSNGEFVTESFESGDIRGSITLNENKFIMTSIPYDKNWNVYVDGAKLSGSEVYAVADALIGFSLPAGAHSLHFVYRNTAFVAGLCISSVSFAGSIAYALIFIKKKKDLTEVR